MSSYVVVSFLISVSTCFVGFYFGFFQLAFFAAAASVFIAAIGNYFNYGMAKTKIVPLVPFNINSSPLDNFEANAKNILEHFYLTPYPKSPIAHCHQEVPLKENIKNGSIERVIHGSMHASRVAAYVEHLHALFLKHNKTIEHKLTLLAKVLKTDKVTLLKLTKYAALFHDSGRQNDGTDYWDNVSAENCRVYLRKKKVPEHLVRLISAAAEHKDNDSNFINELKKLNQQYAIDIPQNAADYLRRLIHDADCLDMIRCREKYDVGYLHIMREFKNNVSAKAEIIKTCQDAAAVIYKQGDAGWKTQIVYQGKTVAKATPNKNFNLQVKVVYEQAKNPYVATVRDLVKQGFKVDLKVKTLQAITPQLKHNRNSQDGYKKKSPYWHTQEKKQKRVNNKI